MPFIYKLIYTFIAQTYLKKTFEKKNRTLFLYIIYVFIEWSDLCSIQRKKLMKKGLKVWVSRYFGVEGSDLFSSTCGFYMDMHC